MIPTLFQKTGPLTEQLLLEPKTFGLGPLPIAKIPDSTTNMVCGYCSTGCGLKIHIQDGQAINLTPTADYPVNLGMACPKGWEALRVLQSDDRATTPIVRNRADGTVRDASWPEAVEMFCDRLKDIQTKYGNDSVAFISTGQIPTEEMAFLGALAKFGMGDAVLSASGIPKRGLPRAPCCVRSIRRNPMLRFTQRMRCDWPFGLANR